MKSRTRSGLFGIAAISCLAATAGAAPTVFAAPNTPSDKLCTITYPVPDGEFTVEASSDVFAVSGNNGSFDLTLHTDARSDIGYNQKFSVTWANIDTGRNGQADTSARVQGPENVLSIPGVQTEPGRIALVLAVANNDGGQNYTNGDCSVEYQAR
ncbi:hypothetical protein [Nocardia iowensis]|uniref:Secreted protein n=1 Tax=Nocardia iowensis TaxID=204891 RepID=A0ABX8RK66_NOCIO|nr:hypothetical protein [Nocardia iowensis]QXN90038.1 hypothetical protein KV110_32055 [Nocardia iowensis]